MSNRNEESKDDGVQIEQPDLEGETNPEITAELKEQNESKPIQTSDKTQKDAKQNKGLEEKDDTEIQPLEQEIFESEPVSKLLEQLEVSNSEEKVVRAIERLSISPERFDAYKYNAKNLDMCVNQRFGLYVEQIKERREFQFNENRNVDEATTLKNESKESEENSKSDSVTNTNITKSTFTQRLEPSEEGLNKSKIEVADDEIPGKIDYVKEKLRSEDQDEVHNAVTTMRRLLSIEGNPPIQQVIESGCVPALVQMLMKEDNPKIQLEASWAVTNIASGTSEQTRYVVSLGVIPCFMNLLKFKDLAIVEQAIWGLGNICGDSPQFRDLIISSGVADAFVELLPRALESQRLTLIRNLAWAMSNLVRGKPKASLDVCRAVLPAFAQFLALPDDELKTDAAWAISYISDGPNEHIQIVIDQNLVPALTQLVHAGSIKIVVPCLRSLGNIATGDDHQTQTVCDAGCIPRFIELLDSPKKNISKESAWTLSNIAAGNRQQIEQLLQHDCVSAACRIIETREMAVAKEGTWIIANMTSGGSPDQLRRILDMGGAKGLALGLRHERPHVGLEGLINLARQDGGNEEALQKIIDALDDTDTLDLLLDNRDDPQQHLWGDLVEALALDDEDDDDDDDDDAGAGYNFGQNDDDDEDDDDDDDAGNPGGAAVGAL